MLGLRLRRSPHSYLLVPINESIKRGEKWGANMRGRQLLNRLSDRDIKAAKGPRVLNDGGGLRCRVSVNGHKTWVYRYQLAGKVHDLALGNYINVSLAEAREKAAEQRRLAKSKIDPLEARNAAHEADTAAKLKAIGGQTFKQALDAYIAREQASWKGERTKAAWFNSVTTHASILLDKPCEQINAQDIFDVFDPLWHTKNDIAARLQYKVERILSDAYTADAGHKFFNRDWTNPARWKHHLENRYGRNSRHVVKHYAALAPADVCGFVSKLRTSDTTPSLVMEFVLLTGVRTGTARQAVWSQIDFERMLWTIPAQRMKHKRAPEPHVVPLAPRAMQIIEEMRLRNGMGADDEDPAKRWVFRGRDKDGRMGERTLRTLNEDMGYAGANTPHGLRAAFKTWANDHGIEDNLSEAILAHSEGAVKAAYNRSDFIDRKRVALTAWQNFIEAKPADNVLPLFG